MIKKFSAGDIVTVEYNNGTTITGELIHRPSSPQELGIAVGARPNGSAVEWMFVSETDGYRNRYIEQVALVESKLPEEPPFGTTTECDGCGARHFHTKDGWVSADGGSPLTWWDLMNMNECGRHEVVHSA